MKNERVINKVHKLTAALIVMLLLVCAGVYLSAGAYTERAAIVSSDGSNVNVRSGPGTSYGWVASLADKTRVTIIGEAMASDGSKWYEIRFVKNEAMVTGFMHSTYLVYEDYSGLDEAEKKTFEELLAEFPESYKERLLILHDMYPQWKFVAMKTGLQWEDALAAESDGWISLVSTNAISSWKSTEGDAYDWNTSTWKPMDGPKWVTASKDIVAYYLDPRNYLDGSMIFAFITHEYDEAEQNIEGVKSVIGKSFMSKDFAENGQTYSYAQVLMEAARAYGVSPYVLAAMIRIEIGYNGDSASISGVEPGYENLYNYYNVGAYATATMTANQRGLWYAAGAGEGQTSYGRPWDSRYKSLMGGAEYYATGYVARGQNTLYLKRFNVTPNNTYGHQYMTNIQGAASEANVYSLAYNAEAKQQGLLFYIPVYENMPESPCVKPTKTGSPNNKLGEITVDGAPLADFHMDTNAYRIEVGAEVDKIVVGAAPKDGTAQISGTGELPLTLGENKLTLSCTAQNGDVRTYTLTVNRAISTDAGLKSLTLSAGVLGPVFNSEIYDYSVLLDESVTELFVTATANSKQATVEIIGAGKLPWESERESLAEESGSESAAGESGSEGTTGEAGSESAAGESGSEGTTGEAGSESAAGESGSEGTTEESGSESSTEESSTEEQIHEPKIITVKITAGDGTTVKEYRIRVERLVPNPDVVLTSGNYNVNDNKSITGITEFPVSSADFAAKLSVAGGSVKLFNADGVTEATTVGTGTKVYVYDADEKICGIYTVVIYGDVSGDGVIDALDLMMLRQYLKNKIQLADVYLEATNISHDKAVDALDLMMLRQYLKNRWEIEQ